MAARPRRQGARGAPIPWAPVLGLVAVAVLGGVLLVRSFGGFGDDSASSAPPPGTVAVPVAGRPVAAYQALELEDLLDPRTSKLSVVHLPEESILPETVTEARDLLGRVLARDKQPGRVFRNPDFLPEGTRPGLVAGIPAGKVALRIEARKVTGSVGLRRGDRFDLVATWRRDANAVGSIPGSATGARADVDLVAENAAVVTPLSERQLPAGAGGRPGATLEEMVIAVNPDEIARVTEALELATRVDCVPRSGRPMTDLANQDAISRSASRVDRSAFGRQRRVMVDTIQGGERSFLEVPGAVSAGPPEPGS
ncbi:MAG: hypothetical protein AAF430_03605 [Myxococcota bacterium]